VSPSGERTVRRRCSSTEIDRPTAPPISLRLPFLLSISLSLLTFFHEPAVSASKLGVRRRRPPPVFRCFFFFVSPVLLCFYFAVFAFLLVSDLVSRVLFLYTVVLFHLHLPNE